MTALVTIFQHLSHQCYLMEKSQKIFPLFISNIIFSSFPDPCKMITTHKQIDLTMFQKDLSINLARDVFTQFLGSFFTLGVICITYRQLLRLGCGFVKNKNFMTT